MPSFRNHPVLEVFSADSNSLSSFPDTFPYLPGLTVLILSNNEIDDRIPEDLWTKIPSALTVNIHGAARTRGTGFSVVAHVRWFSASVFRRWTFQATCSEEKFRAPRM